MLLDKLHRQLCCMRRRPVLLEVKTVFNIWRVAFELWQQPNFQHASVAACVHVGAFLMFIEEKERAEPPVPNDSNPNAYLGWSKRLGGHKMGVILHLKAGVPSVDFTRNSLIWEQNTLHRIVFHLQPRQHVGCGIRTLLEIFNVQSVNKVELLRVKLLGQKWWFCDAVEVHGVANA